MMFKAKLALGLLLGVTVAGLSLWSAPALAFSINGVKSMSALGVGVLNPETAGLCGPANLAKAAPMVCANGSSACDPSAEGCTCPCYEYTGALTGGNIGGAGAIVFLDLVLDISAPIFTPLPSLQAPEVCFAATAAAVTTGSPSPLPSLVFSASGTYCSTLGFTPDALGVLGTPGGFSGGMAIINGLVCPTIALAGTPCLHPLATGGGTFAMQFLPDTPYPPPGGPGSVRLEMSGQTQMGPVFNKIPPAPTASDSTGKK
jgi:hypothetical protein